MSALPLGSRTSHNNSTGDILPSANILKYKTRDVVKIHFTIALFNEPGRIVEESRKRYIGIPFLFLLGKRQVIAGFDHASML
jgi:hypothetical protein